MYVAWALMMVKVAENTSFQTATRMNGQAPLHLTMLTMEMGQVMAALSAAPARFHFLNRSPSSGRHGIRGVRPLDSRNTVM